MKSTPASASPGRLTKGYQYRRVYKEGRLVRGEILWVYLFPASGNRIRLGVSISRRVIKKATARNGLNRTIREWVRQNRKSTEGGYEAVVVVKKDIPLTKANLRLIKGELSRLLEKISPPAKHETACNKTN